MILVASRSMMTLVPDRVVVLAPGFPVVTGIVRTTLPSWRTSILCLLM